MMKLFSSSDQLTMCVWFSLELRLDSSMRVRLSGKENLLLNMASVASFEMDCTHTEDVVASVWPAEKVEDAGAGVVAVSFTHIVRSDSDFGFGFGFGEILTHRRSWRLPRTMSRA